MNFLKTVFNLFLFFSACAYSVNAFTPSVYAVLQTGQIWFNSNNYPNPWNSIYSGNPFTVTAWVNVPTPYGSPGYLLNTQPLSFIIEEISGTQHLSAMYGSTTVHGPALPLNTWTYVSISYQGNKKWSFTVNNSTTSVTASRALSAGTNSQTQLYFFTEGSVSTLRVYDVSLSASQIAADQSGTRQTGLVAEFASLLIPSNQPESIVDALSFSSTTGTYQSWFSCTAANGYCVVV